MQCVPLLQLLHQLVFWLEMSQLEVGMRMVSSEVLLQHENLVITENNEK